MIYLLAYLVGFFVSGILFARVKFPQEDKYDTPLMGHAEWLGVASVCWPITWIMYGAYMGTKFLEWFFPSVGRFFLWIRNE